MELLQAAVAFESDYGLEEIADILSKRMFGGIPFGGLSECIHEEVPAVFIREALMGMQVILEYAERVPCYCMTFGYYPEMTEKMTEEELTRCAFFQRGFEEYVKKVLAQMPMLRVLQ